MKVSTHSLKWLAHMPRSALLDHIVMHVVVVVVVVLEAVVQINKAQIFLLEW